MGRPDFLVDRMVQGDMEDIEQALGWVVQMDDYEYQYTRIYGLFDEPAAALECAEKIKAERDRESLLGTVNVFPLLPPDKAFWK